MESDCARTVELQAIIASVAPGNQGIEMTALPS